MKHSLLPLILSLLPLSLYSQSPSDYDSSNGIVTIAPSRMFQISSPNNHFTFKPYLMLQTSASINYYDDEGLDKAYNQDNIANSGFSIPYAILGFTGKAWSKVTYNLSINASASGAGILQQAWFDVYLNSALQIKVGKFKTPFSSAYLTTLGETLMPSLPTSLTASAIMPYVLNAQCPNIGTGFDLGIMLHGNICKWWTYEAGIFNGNGAGNNSANKTLSDDWHIPSLLYATRIAWTPMGAMPRTQGNNNLFHEHKLEAAISANINVEAESESTNDTRIGIELNYLNHRLYLGGEAYMMNVGFTKRQKINESFNYIGGYLQAGYFIHPQMQVAARYDFMDRNGSDKDGFLNMPALGCNYFIKNTGLKLSAMYQFIGRTGHQTQLDRDNDDLGIAKHSGKVMLQYSF